MRLYYVDALDDNLIRLVQDAPIPNVLVSFAYAGRDLDESRRLMDELRAHGVDRIFLDSGAFTAWNKGIEIDIEAYEACIEALQPDVYVQLDVIGDPAATRANLERMRADGFDPVPVFTRGADWDDLRRLKDEGDYIALGNIAKEGDAVRREWLSSVFAILGPGIRTHGFGVTTPRIMLDFPFYSVDSATAQKAAGYGNVLSKSGGRPRAPLSQRNLQKKKSSAWDHAHLFDNVDGAYVGGAKNRERLVHNITALHELAQHVTKVWAARGVVWQDEIEEVAR